MAQIFMQEELHAPAVHSFVKKYIPTITEGEAVEMFKKYVAFLDEEMSSYTALFLAGIRSKDQREF